LQALVSDEIDYYTVLGPGLPRRSAQLQWVRRRSIFSARS
jgi:hypothetical protein